MKKIKFEDFRRGVGAVLKQERQRRSLTIENVSQDLNILAKKIDRLERGRVSPFSMTRQLLEYYNKKINIELVE